MHSIGMRRSFAVCALFVVGGNCMAQSAVRTADGCLWGWARSWSRDSTVSVCLPHGFDQGWAPDVAAATWERESPIESEIAFVALEVDTGAASTDEWPPRVHRHSYCHAHCDPGDDVQVYVDTVAGVVTRIEAGFTNDAGRQVASLAGGFDYQGYHVTVTGQAGRRATIDTLRAIIRSTRFNLSPAPPPPAEPPAGYHWGRRVAVPDSLVEVQRAGHFHSRVMRHASSLFERVLIDRAESLYPEVEAIRAAIPNPTIRAQIDSSASGRVRARDTLAPRAGDTHDRWWVTEFDGTWIPFAITAGAVRYYIERVRDYAGRELLQPRPVGMQPAKAVFEYEAAVRATADSGAAYVVELKLRWAYWCGSLCAMSFVHTRLVWFDKAGRPMRVTGDGMPSVTVS